MTIQEILKAAADPTIKIRRAAWDPGLYAHVADKYIRIDSAITRNAAVYVITIEDALADDWELGTGLVCPYCNRFIAMVDGKISPDIIVKPTPVKSAIG